MKKLIPILATALLALLWFAPAKAERTDFIIAEIAQTGADTASVLLNIPPSSQTILIKNITLFCDNAGAAGIAYAGICAATAAQTRSLWLGQTVAASEVKVIQWKDLNYRITPATAQAGVIFFVSGASTDTLRAYVDYDLVSK